MDKRLETMKAGNTCKFIIRLIFCALIFGNSEGRKKLLVISRHGISQIFETNPSSEETKNVQRRAWLSPAGARSSFLIGRNLAQRYPNIMSKEFDLQKHVFVSQDSDECLTSTQAMVKGIFQFRKNPGYCREIPFDLIPKIAKTSEVSRITRLPQLLRKFVPFGFSVFDRQKDSISFDKSLSCVTQGNVRKIRIITDELRSISQIFKLMFDRMTGIGLLQNRTDEKISQHQQALNSCKMVISYEYTHSKIFKKESLAKECEFFIAISAFKLLENRQIREYSVSQVWRAIRSKVMELPFSDTDFISVMAYDTSMAAILSLIQPNFLYCLIETYKSRYVDFKTRKMEDCEPPLKYSSTLIIEIDSNDHKKQFVTFILNGKELNSHRVNNYPFNDLIELLEGNFIENMDETCRSDESIGMFFQSRINILTICCFLTNVILFAVIYKSKSERMKSKTTLNLIHIADHAPVDLEESSS
jgi:hypothetical protein